MTVPPRIGEKQSSITRLILSAYLPSPTDSIKHNQGYLEKREDSEASQCQLSGMDSQEVNCGLVFALSMMGGCHSIYATLPENGS